MDNYITIIVDEMSENQRLDAFVSQKTEFTRNSVQILIQENKITVNNKIVAKNYKVKKNDNIIITQSPLKEVDIIPQNIPLDIYYEDNDVLIVNKPKGMVVHPANGNLDGTLVNAILFHCKDSLSGINGEIRPGIVHRIDKDTSGLIVIAKNDKAHEKLAIQFKDHTIKREYVAIAYGNIKQEQGDIEQPIGRHKNDRKKYCVTNTNSKYAFTHYEVIEHLKGFTLIKAVLKTGRTHQIRVHMQFLGHPLAGDPIYGPKAIIKSLNGQALHAGVLGFVHPTTGEYMEFSAEPPIEFKEFYNKNKLR